MESEHFKSITELEYNSSFRIILILFLGYIYLISLNS